MENLQKLLENTRCYAENFELKNVDGIDYSAFDGRFTHNGNYYLLGTDDLQRILDNFGAMQRENCKNALIQWDSISDRTCPYFTVKNAPQPNLEDVI